MNILKVFIVLSGLDDQDFDVRVVGQATSDYTSRRASAGKVPISEFLQVDPSGIDSHSPADNVVVDIV